LAIKEYRFDGSPTQRPAPRPNWPYREEAWQHAGSLRNSCGEHCAKGRRNDMVLKNLPAGTGAKALHACLRRLNSDRRGQEASRR
jgi:hypothetical protein